MSRPPRDKGLRLFWHRHCQQAIQISSWTKNNLLHNDKNCRKNNQSPRTDSTQGANVHCVLLSSRFFKKKRGEGWRQTLTVVCPSRFWMGRQRTTFSSNLMCCFLPSTSVVNGSSASYVVGSNGFISIFMMLDIRTMLSCEFRRVRDNLSRPVKDISIIIYVQNRKLNHQF